MAFAYFITEKYIKENSPVDDNVDVKLLQMGIRKAQDIYIRDRIGSGIYDELCTQITAATLTAANTTLLNQYIAPCLLQYTLYESAENISFQILNKGIQTRNSEFSSPADISAITGLMNKWKNDAEYYANRLSDFLCANSSSYPLFLNPGSTDETIAPRRGYFVGGIFFDDNETRKYKDMPPEG